MTWADIAKIAIPAALTTALLVWGIVSFRRTGARVSIKFKIGKIDEDGVLITQDSPRDQSLARLPRALAEETSENPKPDTSNPKYDQASQFTAVNVLTIYNYGRTGITIQRCTYQGKLGRATFKFEPHAGASPFGDHLPKRLEPGEGCTVVHHFPSMYQFLDTVMGDFGVSASTWLVYLTLGNGKKKYARARMQVEADADLGSDDGYLVTRQIVEGD